MPGLRATTRARRVEGQSSAGGLGILGREGHDLDPQQLHLRPEPAGLDAVCSPFLTDLRPVHARDRGVLDCFLDELGARLAREQRKERRRVDDERRAASGSLAVLAPGFLSALGDQLIGETDTCGNDGESLPEPRKNCLTPFEHEPVVLNTGDEDIARLDP